MTADAARTDAVLSQGPDALRPLFLDADFNAPDDMGDWWLDLGRVDLPA
jgi:hypothetical protein